MDVFKEKRACNLHEGVYPNPASLSPKIWAITCNLHEGVYPNCERFANETRSTRECIRSSLLRTLRAINSCNLHEVMHPVKAERLLCEESNQKLSEGRGQKGLSTLTNLNAVDTRQELADRAGVSNGTMAKADALFHSDRADLKRNLDRGYDENAEPSTCHHSLQQE